MSNVKITEVAEDPSKVKVTLTDLRAALSRLESISPGSVKEEIWISTKDGVLNIDYYYQPPVTVKEIQIDFKITKEGCELKEHRPMCFDNPEMAGTTASAISDGETDEVYDLSDGMITKVEPYSVVDFSMVKNPEPWAVMGEVEKPIPAWAMKKRISAANTLREFQSLLTETR